MSNSYFQFKQFRIEQKKSGMKVATDSCLFGAWVASELPTFKRPIQILDIGTGTGLLSLMLAQKGPDCHVDAVESDAVSFEEARDNFQGSSWADQITAFHKAIQEFDTPRTYDLIVCNPPFYQDHNKGRNEQKNRAVHATDLTPEHLLKTVLPLLAEKGVFYLLYPPHEMGQFEDVATRDLYPAHLVHVKHRLDSPTIRIMTKFEKGPAVIKRSELTIRQENGKYTNAFWALLKDYYLENNNPSSPAI